MKKYFYLVMCVFCLNSLNIQAQTWTAPTLTGSTITTGTTYYLYNVGSNGYLTRGGNYFTQAVVSAQPRLNASTSVIKWTATNTSGSIWTFQYNLAAVNVASNFLFPSNASSADGSVFTDNTTNNTWNVVQTDATNKVYSIQVVSGYGGYVATQYLGTAAAAEVNNTTNATGGTGTFNAVRYNRTSSAYTQWEFVAQADFDLYNAKVLLDRYMTYGKNKGMDISSYITTYNAGVTANINSAASTLLTALSRSTISFTSNSFEDATFPTGWTNSGGFAKQTNVPGMGWTKDGSAYCEKYIASSYYTSGTTNPGKGTKAYLAAGTIIQTVSSLSSGLYELVVSGHAVQQAGANPLHTGAFITAGALSTEVCAGQDYSIENINVTGTTLTVGYSLTGTITCNWTGFDNYRLYYYGAIVPNIAISKTSFDLSALPYSTTFDIVGGYLSADITLTPPTHITLSGTNVVNNGDGTYKILAANANITNTVTATWDGTTSVATSNIVMASGAVSKNIVVSATIVPSILASKTSFSFNTTTNTGTFDITGANITSDITISVPSGITLSGTNVTGSAPTYTIVLANANAVNTVTTTWGKANNIASGTITVASSGATNKTITISTTDDVETATLSGIALNTGALTPSFATGTISYSAKVPADVNSATASITLTGTPTTSFASISNNGTTISAGTPSVILGTTSYSTLNTTNYTVNYGGNLTLADWAANGDISSTSNSLPSTYGWKCMNTTTPPAVEELVWNNFGTQSNCRYTSPSSYTYGGNPWSGRVLFIRWDGGGTTKRVYSYPVYLEGCKSYNFTGKAAYHSVAASGTLTFRVNSAKDNTGSTYGTGTAVLGSTAFVLKDVTISGFSVPTTGVYYITIASDNGALDAIADMSLTLNSVTSLSESLSSLGFTTVANIKSFTVSGNVLSGDITLVAPTGITLNPSTVTASDAQCGKIVTATWDKTANISGNITLSTTGLSDQTIAVSTSNVTISTLSSIGLSSGALLSPTFNSATTSYNAQVPADYAGTVTVTGTATSTEATVSNNASIVSLSSPNQTLGCTSYTGNTTNYNLTCTRFTLDDWDGNGSTDATTSIPSFYGWSASPTLTWIAANGTTAGTVRYIDFSSGTNAGVSGVTYTYSGNYTGRILLVRWDGTGNSSRIYSYPVYLEACKIYNLTAKGAYQSTVPSVGLTFKVTTTKANTGTNYVITGGTITTTSTQGQLIDINSTTVSVPTSGVYYLNLTCSAGAVCGIADLALTQNVSETLSANQSTLLFDHNHLTKTFTVTGNVLNQDVALTTPSGITLSGTNVVGSAPNYSVTAANAQCGVVVTATFDDATSISAGTIAITSGVLSQNISVNTSVDNTCFTPAYTDRSNLITDPYLNQLSNFPSSWGSAAIVTGSESYCGYGSAKLTGINGASVTTANISWSPSASYRVRAMIKTDGIFQFGMQNSYAVEGSNAATYEKLIPTTGNAWQQIDFTFTTGASAVAGFTYFNMQGRTGTLGYIDNWEVYQVTTPTVTINYLDQSNNVLKTARVQSTALNIGSTYTALASDKVTFANTATESWVYDATSTDHVTVVEGSGNVINLKFVSTANTTLSFTFTGASTTNLSDVANWQEGSVPPSGSNINVASGQLVLNQDVTLTNLTVAPAAKVTLNSGKTLTASTVTLQSSPSGTATFVDNGTASITSATVQQYLPQGRNWYVGIPFTDASAIGAGTLTAAGLGTSVAYYDEPNSAWVTNYTGALTRGVGYIAISAPADGSATNNVSFSGTLNTGSVPVALTRRGATKAGFNLVANPYPSYLNAMAAINANANMENTIWYRTKGTTYEFETVNTTSGIGTNVSLTGTVTGYVPPMQAFWVRTLTDNNTITFTNAMRYHAGNMLLTDGTTTVPTTVMKAPSSSKSTTKILRLQVSNGVNSDEAVIYTNDNASNGYDAYDSQKKTNADNSIPEIYTKAGNENLVINGLNSITENQLLPLGFTTGQANTFTIKATEITNFDSSIKIILKDSLSTTEQELTSGSTYSFSSDVASSTGRFSIIFKAVGTTTDINNAAKNQPIVVLINANNQIVVNCNNEVIGRANVSVFNAIGQKLENKTITGTTTVLTNSYVSGVYFVSVLTNGKTTTHKIVMN